MSNAADLITHLRNPDSFAWGDSDWKLILQYSSLRDSCLSPAGGPDDPYDVQKRLAGHAKHLAQSTVADLKLGVVAEKAEDMLELAFRYNDAEERGRSRPSAVRNCPGKSNAARPLKARAWSLLAYIHFEDRLNTPRKGAWNIDSLFRAAECANAAVALGFTSPNCLNVGITVERAGFRRQEDCTWPEHSTGRFEKLEDLWKAVDRRKVQILREQKKWETKAQKDPNSYICAAEGCGIEATRKAGLSKCSGPCVREGKPGYCSKECQRNDWARHKPFCKKGAPVDELAASKRQLVDETTSLDPNALNFAKMDSAGYRFEMTPMYALGKATDRKDEHRVELPNPSGGAPVKVTSSTITPAFMKEVRAHAEALIPEHAKHRV